jgi:predicted DNA-binding mobile mystery protein A
MIPFKISELDKTLSTFKAVKNVPVPVTGWIKAIRMTLGMTLDQVALKLKISKQSASELEARELSGQITLNSLSKIADAMEMKLVYAIVPKEDSLEKLVDSKAENLAKKIAEKASLNMELEQQSLEADQQGKFVLQRKEHLKQKLPKYLWD